MLTSFGGKSGLIGRLTTRKAVFLRSKTAQRPLEEQTDPNAVAGRKKHITKSMCPSKWFQQPVGTGIYCAFLFL